MTLLSIKNLCKLAKKNFSKQGIIFINFDFNNRCSDKLEVNKEKQATDQVIQFPTKSILRPMVFT